MTRTATWERIGTDVGSAESIEDVLHRANLDYTVTLSPIFAAGMEVPKKKATLATYQDGHTEVKGIVSDSYQICQNHEAFDFINDISKQHDFTFVKAGETYTGNVYVIGRLPSFEVFGDEVAPHIIFQNSHNGNSPLRATICALRIVCQNQFTSTFSQQDNAIRLLHTKSLSDRLVASRSVLASAMEYAQHFKEDAQMLYNKKLTTEQVNEIFNTYLRQARQTEQLSERQQAKVAEEVSRIQQIYRCDDNYDFQGTAWGVVNAFADFATHKETRATQKAEDNAFITTAIDPRLMNMLYAITQRVAA